MLSKSGYTLGAARGQGVARALIEAVYARAREAGVRSVYWQTHESNTVAMRLYDMMAARFGFVVYDKPGHMAYFGIKRIYVITRYGFGAAQM